MGWLLGGVGVASAGCCAKGKLCCGVYPAAVLFKGRGGGDEGARLQRRRMRKSLVLSGRKRWWAARLLGCGWVGEEEQPEAGVQDRLRRDGGSLSAAINAGFDIT